MAKFPIPDNNQNQSPLMSLITWEQDQWLFLKKKHHCFRTKRKGWRVRKAYAPQGALQGLDLVCLLKSGFLLESEFRKNELFSDVL